MHFRAAGEGSRIILVGSPAGQFGSFAQTAYAASKAGIVAMARTWSLELARAHVTVIAIIPTAMTAMTAAIPLYAPYYEKFLAGEPLPLNGGTRFGRNVGHGGCERRPDPCAPGSGAWCRGLRMAMIVASMTVVAGVRRSPNGVDIRHG